MKLIKTEDAVGHVLCHDITQIIKGVTKDAVFRKGHIVTEEDIPVLLSVGKENLYVWENDENMLHENEAAQILYDISADSNMHGSEIKEGKIELIADIDGVLMIDRDKLRSINSLGQMMIAGRHSGFPVKKGDKLAGTRVIPLVIEKEKMEQAKEIGGDKPIFSLYNEEKQILISKIEEVYQSWIDVLTKEIEDMDKDTQPFSDVGPRSELDRWKFRMQRLTKVNDFFKSEDYRMVSKYFLEQKNKLSSKRVIFK